MSRLHLLLAGFVQLVWLSGCNGQSNTGAQPASSGNKSSGKAASQYIEGKDFTEFQRYRVMDQTGFTPAVEAYSILIPKNWEKQGEILWTMPGQPCDGVNQYFKASSPDKKITLDIYPIYNWMWSTTPELNQIGYQTYINAAYCKQGQPFDAESFVRNAILPQLPGNPQLVKIEKNTQAIGDLQASDEQVRQELMSYGASQVNFQHSAVNAFLKWSDGSEGLVLCGVTNSENIIPNVYNGTYGANYSTIVKKYIVYRYPSAEKENALNILSVILGSIRTNENWSYTVNKFWKDIRQQRQVAHIGKIRMMDAQTKAIADAAIKSGNQRLQSMNQEVRNWEMKQSTNDKIHNSFIKTIREVEHYQDATGTVELSGGYDHAWSRSDGSSYILTNNPNLDPAAIFLDQQWKVMKKVD